MDINSAYAKEQQEAITLLILRNVGAGAYSTMTDDEKERVMLHAVSENHRNNLELFAKLEDKNSPEYKQLLSQFE